MWLAGSVELFAGIFYEVNELARWLARIAGSFELFAGIFCRIDESICWLIGLFFLEPPRYPVSTLFHWHLLCVSLLVCGHLGLYVLFDLHRVSPLQRAT